jgi:hypothetical protein
MVPIFAHSRNYFTAPKLRHLWIAFPFFVILRKGLVETLPLFDFWWHLKMGQVIVERWSIPRADIFSFTAAGKVFVVQNWLAEIVYYGIYRAGGLPFLIFAHSIMLALVLVPIYCLCRKASGSLAGLVFSVSLFAFCIPGNLRPQVFSYLLFAVYYWLLFSYCEGKQRRIWILPVLMILWVNLHGAFILGLALIAMILVCEGVRAFFVDGEGTLTHRQLYTLGIILALCIVGTMVNPEGYKVYDYVRTVASDPSSRQFVSEWQPPTVNKIQGIVLFYVPFFVLTSVFVCARRRPTLTELALYGAFSVFGMMAIRNAPWFLIIGVPLIARYLPQADCWRLLHRRKQNPALQGHVTPARKESRILNFAIPIGLVAILAIQSPWMQPGRLLDPDTPIGAMGFIDKHALTGNIYHPQAYGDYLIWRLWPKQRSFFDGRVHLFDESFVRYYRQIEMDSHWEELLGKYQISYLLLPKGKPNSEERKMVNKAHASPGWRPLYEDSLSVLFEKRARTTN